MCEDEFEEAAVAPDPTGTGSGAACATGCAAPESGLAEAEGVGELSPGADGDGDETTGGVGSVTGFLELVLGLGFAEALVDDRGFAEALGLPLGPDALGFGPVLEVAVAPPGEVTPGTAAPGPACVGWDLALGTGEVSTWPAGLSSSWPGTGTGSQGAVELPDSRVTTMTAA